MDQRRPFAVNRSEPLLQPGAYRVLVPPEDTRNFVHRVAAVDFDQLRIEAVTPSHDRGSPDLGVGGLVSLPERSQPGLGIDARNQGAAPDLGDPEPAVPDFPVRGRAAEGVARAKVRQSFELLVHLSLVSFRRVSSRTESFTWTM